MVYRIKTKYVVYPSLFYEREREREREQLSCQVSFGGTYIFTIFTTMPSNIATWVLKTTLKSSLNTFFK